MQTRLLLLWDQLRSSYWFIPAVMTIGGIILALIMPGLDRQFGVGWLEDIDWLRADKPDGARSLLSTVAGSIIGVAGVTFSVTIASVVYASGQYGPRLLTNFMNDTGSQVTLGVFFATFLYCLLVLRTIQSGEGDALFVPHLSVLVTLVLALCCVGVLIYFIHHVPDSIHVSHLIADIGQTLNRKVGDFFSSDLGLSAEASDEPGKARLPASFGEESVPIRAEDSGYLQSISEEDIFEVATAHDLILQVCYRPGDFVSQGKPVVRVWPATRLGDDARETISKAFFQGSRRTYVQDLRFLVNELVEIAARALSPGVNDPFTAMSCLDWLGSALETMAGRHLPSAYRYDADGALRVVVVAPKFADFAEGIFGQLRPYVSADRNAALHTFHVLAELTKVSAREPESGILRAHALALRDACEVSLPHEIDRHAVRARCEEVLRRLNRMPGVNVEV